MKITYPIAIERGGNGYAHGAVVPDFTNKTNCAIHIAEDNYEDLIPTAKNVIEDLIENGDCKAPGPSTLEECQALPDFEGWEWNTVVVDVDAKDADIPAPDMLDSYLPPDDPNYRAPTPAEIEHVIMRSLALGAEELGRRLGIIGRNDPNSLELWGKVANNFVSWTNGEREIPADKWQILVSIYLNEVMA